jgi:predicted Zn-dependent protease
MTAGKQAALAGDFAKAIDFWRRSLSSDLQEQRQLVDLLVAFTLAAQAQSQRAGQTDGSAIEFILTEFQPDLSLSRVLLAKLEPIASPDDLNTVRGHFIRVAQAAATQINETEAAPIWIEMSNILHHMKQDQKAVAVLRRALAARPNDYSANFSMAVRLMDVQEYEEAQRHLEWCRLREPDDDHLKNLLTQAVKQQFDRQQFDRQSRTRVTPSSALR